MFKLNNFFNSVKLYTLTGISTIEKPHKNHTAEKSS